jgi:NifB/MoaA-like Fe-S oxidoreductase
MISVTGLLTYADLMKALPGTDLGDEVIISDIMLKPMTDVTLDGKHVPEIAEALGKPVRAVENSARGLIMGALGEEEAGWLRERQYANPYEPSIPDFH